MGSRRQAGWWLAGAVAAGGILAGVHAVQAQAAPAPNPGAVTLNPASGATSSTPAWSTKSACPSGLQGSAIFRAIKADGTTFSISQATNSVAAPFSGKLQAPLSTIQSLAGIRNGGSEEFMILCFSGPSLTGTSQPEMSLFVTYSANGASYTSGSTAPPSSTASAPASGSSSSAGGTGSASSSSSSSPSGTSPASSSASSASPSPSASVSPAPSPTPVNSDLNVTG